MSDPTSTAQAGSASPTAQAGSPATDEPVEEKKFTQAELDTILKDRLERQRRAVEAQQREKEAALETQRLEDQKEFEKLAKQRAEEINSLKPRASLAEGYEKRVAQLMSEATRELPSNIQTILAKLSLPDQLDWLTENLDSLKAPARATASADTNAWSRSAGGSQTLTDDEYRKRKREESIYR